MKAVVVDPLDVARSGVIPLLERLISFPTLSKSSNLELIHFIQDYLNQYAVPSTLLPSDCGTKAALIASIDPLVPGGVVLSGHSDVVPVEGQNWTSDPWTLREQDGHYFGRGACDMKGFLATCLAMVPHFQAMPLKRPIHIVISFDEEIGCFGVPLLIDHLISEQPPVSAVLVGEPTLMQIVNAHKGTWSLMTRVTGYEVHSSLMHEGVSAVMAAARLVTWHDDRTQDNAANAKPSPFNPPYTTLHVGRIKGGTSGNITAGYCSFPTDIRVLPEERMDDWYEAYVAYADTLEEKLQAVRPEARIAISVNARVPGLAVEQDGVAEALVRSLLAPVTSEVGGFGSEAGLFQEAGLSTVVVGPGSIAQAHQPDEFISLGQLAECVALFEGLAAHLSHS